VPVERRSLAKQRTVIKTYLKKSEIMSASSICYVGIMSPLKRKSLPEIAKVVSINSAQSLHHFIANSDWSVSELKNRILNKIKQALKGNAITVVIDKTGSRKKVKKLIT